MLLLLGKNCYYQARSVGTLGAEMVEGASLMVRLSITPNTNLTYQRVSYGASSRFHNRVILDSGGALISGAVEVRGCVESISSYAYLPP